MQSAQPTVTPNSFPTPSHHIQAECARRLKRGDGARISRSKREAMVGGHVVARYDVPSTDGSYTHRVIVWPATNRVSCECEACTKYGKPWCAARQLAVMAGRFEGKA